jgi:hypothetical protein
MFSIFLLLQIHPHVKRFVNEKPHCYPDAIQLSVSIIWVVFFALDAICNCWLWTEALREGKSCCRFMSLARINLRIVRRMTTFLYYFLCAFSNSARELLDVASKSWPLLKATHRHAHIIAGDSIFIWIWMDDACTYCIFFPMPSLFWQN